MADTVFSQARIGKTEKEITTEFKDAKFEMQIYSDTISCRKVIYVKMQDRDVLYGINRFSSCVQTIIYPNSIETLIRMKLKYNELYRGGGNLWRGDDFEIHLIERDGKKPTFIWIDTMNVKSVPDTI